MDIDVPLRELGAIDSTALRDAILGQESSAWNEDESRQESFYMHEKTRSIVLLSMDHDNWPDFKVSQGPGWQRIADVALPVMRKIIKKHYPVGGEVVRAIAARLVAGENIKPHSDVHQCFHCGHRIHVPITTNPKVWFTIDGRPYQFKVGEAYEINNQKQHSVVNKGAEDRITFIFDYYPPGPLAYAANQEKERPESRQDTNPKFRKLLGKERNYLLLRSNFDVEAIKNKVEHIPDARWLESEREQHFNTHRDTQSLVLINFFRSKHTKPDYRELYFEFENEIKSVVDCIAEYYQNNGFLVRMLLAKLPAGGQIANHTDSGDVLLNCHRVHIPIITNDKVVFAVGGEEKNMQVGELWEIDNELVHSVENHGDEDRIHLIIDWVPNYTGRPEENVLASFGQDTLSAI